MRRVILGRVEGLSVKLLFGSFKECCGMVVISSARIVKAIIPPIVGKDSLPLPGSESGMRVIIGAIARENTKELPHEL